MNHRVCLFFTAIFVALSCFLYAEIEVSFSFSVPFSVQESIGNVIGQCLAELDEIHGYTLSFPIRVEIQREPGLGVRGEASFDGHKYVVFFNPSLSDLPYLIRHEIMHLYTFEWIWRTRETVYSDATLYVLSEIPLWVIEGMAVWYENRAYNPSFHGFPWDVTKNIAFLQIESYPKGENLYQYYELLSDFFQFFDARVDLAKYIRTVFSFENTEKNWVKRFSTATGEEFMYHYAIWERGKLWLSWVSFFIEMVIFGIPFITIALFMVFLFFIRKRPAEPFDPKYEELYGKEYWNLPEHEKTNEEDNLPEPATERQKDSTSTRKQSPK